MIVDGCRGNLHARPVTFDHSRFAILKEHHLELLIYPNGNSYPIEYSRMDTPEKVLGWVYHLLKKGNVSKEHLRCLIEAARENGVAVGLHA